MAEPKTPEERAAVWEAMKSYVYGGRRMGKSWMQRAWEEAMRSGKDPRFIAWDLAAPEKPKRALTDSDRAIHRAIGFGLGDDRRFGYAQHIGPDKDGGEQS